MSSNILTISKAGKSANHLDNMFCCLITLTVWECKKIRTIKKNASKWNFLYFSLYPLCLLYIHYVPLRWEESLDPSSLPPHQVLTSAFKIPPSLLFYRLHSHSSPLMADVPQRGPPAGGNGMTSSVHQQLSPHTWTFVSIGNMVPGRFVHIGTPSELHREQPMP